MISEKERVIGSFQQIKSSAEAYVGNHSILRIHFLIPHWVALDNNKLASPIPPFPFPMSTSKVTNSWHCDCDIVDMETCRSVVVAPLDWTSVCPVGGESGLFPEITGLAQCLSATHNPRLPPGYPLTVKGLLLSGLGEKVRERQREKKEREEASERSESVKV